MVCCVEILGLKYGCGKWECGWKLVMRKKSKYFRLRRQEQFLRGSCGEPLYWDGGLTLPHAASGVWISRLFDSKEKEAVWYRLHTLCDLPNNTSCQLTVYCSESDTLITPEGRKLDLQTCISSPETWDQKQRWFAPFQAMQLPLRPDLLLYGARGRYLWFTLKLFSAQEMSPKIYQMQLLFGGSSWLEDLPELYQTQDSGFLKSYLAIFQTIYEEMEAAIESSTHNYAPQLAPPEFLRWLASWYCIREQSLWSEEQLRILLTHARELYQFMGTRWSVEFLCRLYLGEPVQIVEYFQRDNPDFVCPPSIRREQIFVDPYIFTVLVPSRLIRSRNQYLSLLRVLDSCKPVYLQANVILISDGHQPGGVRLGEKLYLSEGLTDLNAGVVLREPKGEEKP